MSTVVTFNVHHGAPASGPARIADVAALCASFDADLIAVQELDVRRQRSRWRDQPAVLAAATGLHLTHAPTIRGGMGSYGTAVLSRGPLGAVQFVALPSLGTEARLAILGSVALAGQTVSIAAVHLQATRGLSEMQLDVVMHQLLRRPGPHLVLGDLNMEPERIVPILQRRRFTWAQSEPTFPADDPRRTIDWIAAKGCSIVSVEVPEVRVSDHRPLIAHLA